MNWRTQQFLAFGDLAGSARRAGSLALLGIALAGCEPSSPPPHVISRQDRLSVYGDDLMIQGRKLRDQGIASGDDAMKRRGEALIVQGQQIVNQSSASADQPEEPKPVPGITHVPH